MNVKQERADDAEIQALAERILEASKNRLNLHQKPTQTNQTLNLTSIVDKKKLPPLNAITSGNLYENGTTSGSGSSGGVNNSKPIDDESIRGRFGWDTVGKAHIPYILRNGEKYCSVRMVEMKALNKYLNYLHQDIYNCTCVRSYYITEGEGRLLNEINCKHCDYLFGREQFTVRDLIVRLTDAKEFYNFLHSCYNKLTTGETDTLSRSGFIRINKESVVPYTVSNDQKYVPLFYFEGETDNLKQRANKVEGWDLAYLKFCCKVQGIRNELFSHDSCSVISLNDIKNYFPPGTTFEDYWPKKNVDTQLLISNTRNHSQIIQWTRQPVAPPITHPTTPTSKPIVPPKTINNNQLHNVHGYTYSMATQHPYASVSPRTTTTSSNIRATYPPATGNRHLRTPNYYTISQGPPPLAPNTQPNLHYTNAQSTPNNTYMMTTSEPPLNQMNYQTEDTEEPQPQIHPAPLIPIRQFLLNGGVLPNYLRHQQSHRLHLEQNTQQVREIQNNYNVSNRQSILINQQPAHQQSSRTTQQPSTFVDDHMSNGQMSLDDLNSKLITLPEPTTLTNHLPYRMQKALVEGQLLPCINMKPYVNEELLVTLPDLIVNFFNNIPVQSCQRVMKVLGIDLYKPNNSQTHVLMESGRCQNMNDVVPLVQVRNVIDFMPQLKYMLGGVLPSMSNKRQRNS